MQVSRERMTPVLSAWKRFGDKLDLCGSRARRWFCFVILPIIGVLSVVKFFFLTADFPNYSPWMIDQAKFTDEGWWANAAVMHVLTGSWYVAGDYNPAVDLPVWPVLLSGLFRFTGVSVAAARALNVGLSIATLGVVFALVRRYCRLNAATPALIAVLLMAASPFAFAFNRLAILETPVIFEFCAAMLVASYASAKRVWPLAGLSVLITAMLLTKTTAAILAAPVLWLAWCAMGRGRAAMLRCLLAIVVVPAALFKGYAMLVSALGFGVDYQYFFDVNAMPDFDWRQTLAVLASMFRNCFWIDRVLYPIGLVILVTVAWKRKLWSNPLFTASWLALAAQAVFIFTRQDDPAPRYFLVMLGPLVWVVALTFDRVMVEARKTAVFLLVAIAVSVIANATMIEQFLTHRDYDMRDAATAIGDVIRRHPEQKPLLFGVSGSQISLMTGIPSINDAYSTVDMSKKVESYQPGWFLAWNDVSPANEDYMADYTLEKMGSYPAFDDDDRSVLTLYEMVKKPGVSSGLDK